MTDAPARGWLPISVAAEWNAALLLRMPIRWMRFGDRALTEPFMDQSIGALRTLSPPAREIETSFDTLERLAAALPPVEPAGFIFHISRCGSTLMSNALKLADDTAVFSEPSFLSQLLMANIQVAPRQRPHWEQRRNRLACAVISLYAHARTGRPERVVIKFPSISTLSIATIRAIWPNVPCVMVIRDPVEVIVPSLQGGGWMGMMSSRDASLRILGLDPQGLTPEVYCARVLRQFFRAMLDTIDTGCIIADHRALSPALMGAVAGHFGLSLPTDPEPLRQVMNRYSKAPGPAARFQDDRLNKQWTATPEIRLAAISWATQEYLALQARAAG